MGHVPQVNVQIGPAETGASNFDRDFVLRSSRSVDLFHLHLLDTGKKTGLQGDSFLTLNL